MNRPFNINLHSIGILLLTVLLFGACNNKKYLAENETLYTGADIEYVKEGNFKVSSALKAELKEVIFPETNQMLFGIARPKLWMYNVTKEPKKEKGLRHWLKYKMGAKPVLMEMTNPDQIEQLMVNRLHNNGHFKTKVNYTIENNAKKKTAKVVYTVELEEAYQIDSIFYPQGESHLESRINQLSADKLIKSGDYYQLEALKKERERISDLLRNEGFYYFEPGFLFFELDTNLGNRKLNVYLNIKENIKENYLSKMKLGEIYVYPNFDLRNSKSRLAPDTLQLNGTNYLMQDSSIRPEIVSQTIAYKTGDYYSKERHENTINRLTGLGVFQFVNIRYSPDSSSNKLTPHIELTPNIKKSIRLEFLGTTKSNGFTGPGFRASFQDRNMFKGAEMFSINLEGGYETQLSSASSGLNSYELGINTELSIPRFLMPFNIQTVHNRYTPFTTFKLGYRTLNRLQYYRLNSFSLSYGYRWRETKTKQHELYPVSINYVRLATSSDAFNQILSENPLVRNSFEEQFIMGSIYSFIYDNRSKNENTNNFYYKGTVDVSGSLAQMLSAISQNERFGANTDYEVLGINFSQYVRLENSFKYYIKLNEKSLIANRLTFGAGVPFGNANSLPYIKQFYIGGGNSIRAFQPRSLGPGTYRRSEEDRDGNIFIDQSGDVKLEFNTEYRFDIYSIYKAAVFVDAGNIWLINEDPLRPGGEFKSSQILNQMAVGTGFGLRIDPDFFVIRLDLGFPLRKPYLAEGERWIIKNFGKDPVLNIAIGYPF
ncbi:MAG: BamA/TamA family outer membrane protein [Vicingaceae bacterium]